MVPALIYTFFRFRLRQIGRELMNLGLFYSAIVSGAILFIYYLSWITIQEPGRLGYSLPALLPVLWLYFSRRDVIFLKKLTRDFRFLLFLEYFIIALPYFLSAGFHQKYFLLAISGLITLTLAFFPWKASGNSGTGWKLNFIPKDSFEWKAGIRKNGLILLTVLLISIFTSPLPAVSLILVWIINVIIISFYSNHEGKDILRVSSTHAQKFLRNKIFMACRFQASLQTLPLLAYFTFHPGHWWLILFVFLYSMISVTCTIIFKYAYLDPGTNSNPSSLYQSITVISFLIPFLLPVPMILGIIKRRAAIKRLADHGIKSK